MPLCEGLKEMDIYAPICTWQDLASLGEFLRIRFAGEPTESELPPSKSLLLSWEVYLGNQD